MMISFLARIIFGTFVMVLISWEMSLNCGHTEFLMFYSLL